jgi:selenocysteine-specific elongation factor
MNTPIRSIVIGTAGHIDHGKTTLVRALTGVDTDRLPEEKRRGITIDLGFATFEMNSPDGPPIRISFVDVPGHSLFIRNMLAGAGCVAAVMLVIAADEGVKPQTVEHLAICELLGISTGITVITKAESVDQARLDEVTRSTAEFLRGTFLSNARDRIFQVSARTGEGLDALRAGLLELATRVEQRKPDTPMRMPLDRSFVMKGFGTVVTGTLLSGQIQEGQTLHLEPGSRAVRVRGLQTHGQGSESAQAGTRVALNLAGIDADKIRRGQTLIAANTLSLVEAIDAEIRLLPDTHPLKHRASVHFHAFTAGTMASVSLYGYEAVQPGSVRLARIKLSEPMLLVPGDRFVLRQPSPAGTIGGGRVVDIHPEARQRKSATLAWLEQLRTCSIAQQLLLRTRRRGAHGTSLDALAKEVGVTVEAVRRDVDAAIQCGHLLLIASELLLSREAFHAASTAVLSLLQSGQSLKSSELRSQLSLSQQVFDFVMRSLASEKKVEIRGEAVSLFGAGLRSSSVETERLAAIAEAYKAAGLAPPSVPELALRLNLKEADMRRLVTALQRDQTIVRMGSDDLFIHSDALQQLAGRLAPLRGSLMEVARFKQLTGLSRKYAIPLLEYLDRQRLTRKQGDHRLVL